MSIAGPWLHISGAIFVDVFIVQTFLEQLYLGGNPYETTQIRDVAKVFEMVARAVKLLKRYYRELRVRTGLKPSLPSPTFSDTEPPQGTLTFKGQLFFEGKADRRRPLFRAELNNISVIIKFCEFYGETAHRTLAAEGLAPTLHYCSRITGGTMMVIMDELAGQDAGCQFKDSDLPLTVIRDIKQALEVLHRENLVFGDVRRPNIVVMQSPDKYGDNEWHGQLIDFDWSGPVGDARYPLELNPTIRWAHGVVGGAVILPQHDRDMLDQAW